MKQEYIGIETFLELAGVKERTVRKNKDKIPGLSFQSGKYTILKGTRYPYNLRNAKLKDSADRRYYLLHAISKYQYIDAAKLKIYSEQFKELLKELLSAGLIKENHLGNSFGANAYDCTIEGDKILKNQKKDAILMIGQAVSSSAGHFVGAIISEIAK